jgi:hypothetical protein
MVFRSAEAWAQRGELLLGTKVPRSTGAQRSRRAARSLG